MRDKHLPCSLLPLFPSVWRHVDKGTPEGVIDAMLIHGQGEDGVLGLAVVVCGTSDAW